MYCDGRCQYLNERKHKCELTGEKLTYMKQTGSISFSVHEHRGFCKGDENSAHDKQRTDYPADRRVLHEHSLQEMPGGKVE